jgi:hypothetical protein
MGLIISSIERSRQPQGDWPRPHASGRDETRRIGRRRAARDDNEIEPPCSFARRIMGGAMPPSCSVCDISAAGADSVQSVELARGRAA